MIIPGIVFLPFFSFIAIGLLGRFLGGYLSGRVATVGMFYSMLFSWMACWYFALDRDAKFVAYPYNWFTFGSYFVDYEFVLDTLTVLMFAVVTTVSFWVHYYSIEYMDGDPHRPRFFAYLSLFTFFMLFLVSAPNLIQLFVGWEGVGLCSFLLINFWFTRYQANKSAIKAVLMNRFGDIALLFAISLLALNLKTSSFHEMKFVSHILLDNSRVLFGHIVTDADLIAFSILVAAVGKSAQLGLHTWLPDAMEGPTPVSALIHAATMVTAGVFLLLRTSFILELSPTVKTMTATIGCLTALFGATTGAFQNDIKKVIAFSTCSQLGYMVFACGIGAYQAAMFHLFNHAFFKALLFLSAGSVIHAFSDEQDMRKMGGLLNLMPFTYLCFLIGSLSLMGFPFLTGFYSKDFIIELAGSFGTGSFYYMMLVAAAFFTSYYSVKLIVMVFISEPRGPRAFYENVHEPRKRMTYPLLMLFISTLFFGFMHKDMFIGVGTHYWWYSLPISRDFANQTILSEILLDAFIRNVPFLYSILGGLMAYFVYYSDFDITRRSVLSQRFFSKKWYWDHLYNYFIAFNAYKFFYYVPFKNIDKGLLEFVGPSTLVEFFGNLLPKQVRKLGSGFIFDYLVLIVVSFIGIIISCYGIYYFYDACSPEFFGILFVAVIIFPHRLKYLKDDPDSLMYGQD